MNNSKFFQFLPLLCIAGFSWSTLVQAQDTSSTETTVRPINQSLASDLLNQRLSINFQDANIRAVFDIIAQTAGINFVFDRDIKADLKTTIHAKNATLFETLDLILKTSNLRYKIINQKTLLVYPDSLDKIQQYEDLTVRNFVLKSADMKKIQEVLKTILNPKFIYIDERNRLLTLRDRPDILEAAEKLIAVYDVSEPEVMLEVKVFEVSKDRLYNLGITLPGQVAIGLRKGSDKNTDILIDDLLNISKGRLKISGIDPLATINLKDSNGSVNLLAAPSLRVKNREKAKILVGDKVPVITSTINQVSSSVTESVSYLDVGLKLEAEPEIQINDEVLINLNLEVSNIVKEIRTNTGLLTYQIGTRNSSTVLQLKDNETQVLAGLIQEQERLSNSNIPGLSKIPILGNLFSSHGKDKTRSEIVLSITPKIIRRSTERLEHIAPFSSGTQNYLSLNSTLQGNGSFASELQDNPSIPELPPSLPATTTAQSPRLGEVPVKLILPEHSSVDQSLNVALQVQQALPEKSKVQFVFDRNAFNLVDVRTTASASSNVTYNTTLQGIEFQNEGALPALSSLALITLQPYAGYSGKVNFSLQTTTQDQATPLTTVQLDIKPKE